ncbi:MAG: hypothetical protein R6V00_08900 [Candidatus Aminicenantes bacterium]
MKNDLIALFDMDGTLFDYAGSLKKKLKKIKSPQEPEVSFSFEDNPRYLQNRIDLITESESFWSDMPKLQLGWDIFQIAEELEYHIHILTQGPRSNPAAWSGKKKCIDKHFGEDFSITLTRDKGLVYGTVLVENYPKYIERWLNWRKRGLVIMPANEFNKSFRHPQVIRYDGSNLEEVGDAMGKRKEEVLEKKESKWKLK